MKDINALQRIFQLSEYVKLSAAEHKANNHHRLKNDLSKSSRRILYLLKDGSLNQRTISKILNISPQAISEAVKKLELQDLVTKEKQSTETIITLTNKGIIESNTLKEIIQNHANIILADLSEEEIKVFIQLVNKIIKMEDKNV